MGVYVEKKDEVLDVLKRIKTLLENESSDDKIKVLNTDTGGEFTSKEFKLYCDSVGIMRHLTALY